jgi:glycosyltransferase involved in cell wall biosynthesis
MTTVAIVSYRLGGLDGVSIEAAKWAWAIGTLGCEIRTVAGAGPVDILVPGLAMDAETPPTSEELESAFADCALVIVENMASLPLNPEALAVLYDVLEGRSVLFRHHDFTWQRPHLAHLPSPRHRPGWAHVTINELSRVSLAHRGIDADVIRNHFDCDPPRGNREATRNALGATARPILLFPSRSIPRKNVGAACNVAEQLNADLWILGPSEDGFEPILSAILDDHPGTVFRGSPTGCSIHDAYAAADMVVLPSRWEGFGNPLVESVTHQRPLALNVYPVAEELIALGFSFTPIDALDALRHELEAPNHERFTRNLAVAREHLNLNELPQRLTTLLQRRFSWWGY